MLGLMVHANGVICANATSTDEAWTEVINTLTAAAITFEMLSTAHQSGRTVVCTETSRDRDMRTAVEQLGL